MKRRGSSDLSGGDLYGVQSSEHDESCAPPRASPARYSFARAFGRADARPSVSFNVGAFGGGASPSREGRGTSPSLLRGGGGEDEVGSGAQSPSEGEQRPSIPLSISLSDRRSVPPLSTDRTLVSRRGSLSSLDPLTTAILPPTAPHLCIVTPLLPPESALPCYPTTVVLPP